MSSNIPDDPISSERINKIRAYLKAYIPDYDFEVRLLPSADGKLEEERFNLFVKKSGVSGEFTEVVVYQDPRLQLLIDKLNIKDESGYFYSQPIVNIQSDENLRATELQKQSNFLKNSQIIPQLEEFVKHNLKKFQINESNLTISNIRLETGDYTTQDDVIFKLKINNTQSIKKLLIPINQKLHDLFNVELLPLSKLDELYKSTSKEVIFQVKASDLSKKYDVAPSPILTTPISTASPDKKVDKDKDISSSPKPKTGG